MKEGQRALLISPPYYGAPCKIDAVGKLLVGIFLTLGNTDIAIGYKIVSPIQLKLLERLE